jgi:hypothetical protein
MSARSYRQGPGQRTCAGRLSVFWFLGLVLIAATLGAEQFGDIGVSLLPTPEGMSFHGYAEMRFVVSNRIGGRARQVTLTYPKSNYSYYGNNIRSVSRTLEIGPGQSSVVSLFQPPLECNGANVEVLVDGYPVAPELHIPNIQHMKGGGYGSAKPCLLISPSLQRDDVVASRSPKKYGYDPDIQVFRDETPVRDWSPNWLGYTRYDGIFVTSHEWETAPAAISAVLQRYAESGGCLVVYGHTKFPEHWVQRKDAKGLRLYHSLLGNAASFSPVSGRGTAPAPRPGTMIPNVTPSLGHDDFALPEGEEGLLPEDDEIEEFPEYERGKRVGKGNAKPVNSSGRMFSVSAQNELKSLYLTTGEPFQKKRTAEEANRTFQIVEGVGIPVRGLMTLMLLFTIVIGPLNLMVLNSWGRRIWVLWTVPLISLITCVAVFIYASMGEGWRSKVRIESVTFLREDSQRAITLGWMACYSPLTLGGGFHFSNDTEITPQLARSPRGSVSMRTLDWSSDQHLADGWVTARVPAHFMVRTTETRQERLNIHALPTGEFSVVNGLGAPIRTLYFATRSGRVFVGSDIAPGQETRLNSREGKAEGGKTMMGRFRSLYQSDWSNVLTSIPQEYSQHLPPNGYIAILDQNPFLHHGLKSVSMVKSGAVVVGFCRENFE